MEGTGIGSGSRTPAGNMMNREYQNIPPADITTVDSICGEMEMTVDEKEDHWFDRPYHPLMNNLILNNIFKHLRGNELKECRLVCTKWNILTIPFIRKVISVYISGNDDLLNAQRNFRNGIHNFVDVLGSNRFGIPFARFVLGPFCTTEGDGQKFLQLCGNTITDLEFSLELFNVEDVSQILRSTVKLETLKIPKRLRSSSGSIVELFPEESKPRLMSLKHFTVYYDELKERNKFCPTFLEEVITAAENISCLTLYDSYPLDRDSDQVFSSFEVLSLIEKLGRESSIQELQISISSIKSDHSDYVDLLHKMAAKQNGLKLKKLQYTAGFPDQDSRPIVQITSLWKHALEILKVEEMCFNSLKTFKKMTRLTHLDLSSSNDFDLRLINLREIFPVLETLYLGHTDIDCKCDEFFPESEPCPTVTSLEIFALTLTLNGFNQMLTVFPNLTDLVVNIAEDGEEILRQIWTQMTQLESLRIYGSIQINDSLDSVFTGIPGFVLHEIRDELIYNLERMETKNERRENILDIKEKYSQLPSIGNLTKLRHLSLELTGYDIGDDERRRCGWEYLTDLTGYLGFHSLKNLKELDVEHCELTKTCCEILIKDMGLVSWEFKSSEDSQNITDSSI